MNGNVNYDSNNQGNLRIYATATSVGEAVNSGVATVRRVIDRVLGNDTENVDENDDENDDENENVSGASDASGS